ncbi:MAG: hypothetical protein NUV46_03810 [Nanoarchaeota archaeon]|nr:hypothetical protein [Nanoarchaeota archaeon]
MKIKYFKNYENLHDCYVGEKNGKSDYFNIVSISKRFFHLFANDEGSSFRDGRFDGFYRLMKVEKRDFDNLKGFAINKNRKKGLTLIRKFHEENPDLNPNVGTVEGDTENFDREKTFEFYIKAKPILE